MILITGATGLVGAHLLLSLCQSGHRVRALYRNESKMDQVKTLFLQHNALDLWGEIHWCQGDILDIPSLSHAFKGVSYVYHCAALVSFDPKDEELLRKTNIEGTANIVNYCIDYAVKKLCHVSSIAALGDLKEFETTINEDTEWNPETEHTDYAISKYGGEMEVWRGYQEGLNVVIVNPGVIIAPPFWTESSGSVYRTIKQNNLFYTAGSTGYIVVNDVVAIMKQLMERGISGNRYVLVGEHLSYKAFITSIRSYFQLDAPKHLLTPFLLAILWRIDGFFSLFGKKRVLTKQLAKTLTEQTIYDASKIKTTLHYNFDTLENYLFK